MLPAVAPAMVVNRAASPPVQWKPSQAPATAPAAVGAGSVWVTSRYDRTVERIDPERGKIVARIHLDSAPQGVLVADGRVWVTTHS